MTVFRFVILPLAVLASPALAVEALPNSAPASLVVATGAVNDIAPFSTALSGAFDPIAANLPAPVDRAEPVPVNIIAATAPEPGAWALLIAGFGLVGWAARRRRILPPASA